LAATRCGGASAGSPRPNPSSSASTLSHPPAAPPWTSVLLTPQVSSLVRKQRAFPFLHRRRLPPILASMGKCRICGKEAGAGFVLCETCARTPKIAGELDSGPPPASSPLHPGYSYLESVRSQSCYAVLRGLINVITGLNIFVLVILAGYLIATGATTSNVLLILGGLAVGVCGCFLTIASRQASLLLVDIADLLIEQSRGRSENPEHSGLQGQRRIT
jgi:hypothetical protein